MALLAEGRVCLVTGSINMALLAEGAHQLNVKF